MTQENKQLLLVDLCGRLPYGVIMQVTMYDIQGKYDEDKTTTNVKLSDGNIVDIMRESHWISYKPYLRPLSSMTEEEWRECVNLGIGDEFEDSYGEHRHLLPSHRLYDWLNAHHFDYRGLIPKGLAISTEEFNPYKD